MSYLAVVVLVALALLLGFFAADVLWRLTRPSAGATALGTQQAAQSLNIPFESFE